MVWFPFILFNIYIAGNENIFVDKIQVSSIAYNIHAIFPVGVSHIVRILVLAIIRYKIGLCQKYTCTERRPASDINGILLSGISIIMQKPINMEII